MAKANKDGWIRHRGGKQPVADNEFVQARLRDGTIQSMPMKAGFYYWDHESESSDIMAYRIHPTEQQEPQPMTAEQIRTKYIENLASIADLHKQNAALVDDLRKIGFDFYDTPKEPQEDMSDPKNWRVGDELEVITKTVQEILPFGSIQRITAIEGGKIRFTDTCGSCLESIERITKYFKFHSRPAK